MAHLGRQACWCRPNASDLVLCGEAIGTVNVARRGTPNVTQVDVILSSEVSF